MKKSVKILGAQISPWLNMSICPVGLYLNKTLRTLKPRTLIELVDAWRHTPAVLIRQCALQINTPLFTFLLKNIYGEQATWQWLADNWTALCVNEGLGKGAFLESECVLIQYAEYIAEEYEAEEKRIAELEEAERKRKERQAEKQRLLRQAKRGIYEHPDIISP